MVGFGSPDQPVGAMGSLGFGGNQRNTGANSPYDRPDAKRSRNSQTKVGTGGQYYDNYEDYDDKTGLWKTTGHSQLFDPNGEKGKQQDALTAADEKRRFGYMQQAMTGLQSSFNQNGGGGGAPIGSPTLAGGGSNGIYSAPVGAAAAADQGAAFAAAKARAGAMGRSAVNGLRSEMSSRGIMGSGVEGRGLTDRLAAATNPLSDINVAQLHENTGMAQHNQDLAADAAKTQFGGDVAMRGQDVTAQTARQSSIAAALSGMYRGLSF